MCKGEYEKDLEVASLHKRIKYDRRKAVYYLRNNYRKIGGKNCIYCGFKAQTGDHVPALFKGYINGVIKGVVVSSCYECNSHLGAFESTCIKKRAKYLKSVYDALIKKTENTYLKADYNLKSKRCEQRIYAPNCNMLEGSAKLFKENGEYGGENSLFNYYQSKLK